MKIVTVNQMQKAEKDCGQFGISLDQLMENAGKAVAEELRRLGKDIRKQNILVLVGPGNNGGDGLVAARYLHDWGARVTVYLCSSRPPDDSNLAKVRQRGITCLEASADNNLIRLGQCLQESGMALDAVFGTGTSRPITGLYAGVLNTLSRAKQSHPGLFVAALDLPSGLNADSGTVDAATPTADVTITLGFPKVGLFNMPGMERAGKITVVDIGIPPQVVDYVNLDYLTDDWIKSALPHRPLISHKGTFGKILALTGSINYLGAAYLACTASIRSGAGLTILAIARSLLPVLASKMTEVIYLPLPESSPGIASLESAEMIRKELSNQDVFLVGCGIGQDPAIIHLVETLLLESPGRLPPIVLDADGLSMLAKMPDWKRKFKSEAIFTPHAGEMSRLLGAGIEEIQTHRLTLTRDAATEWNKTVVLKGPYTVIASPDGRIRVSPFANAGLASAGTGDVLAGSIAGLLAQGLSLFDAAACGVYLHGQAGEMVKAELGDTGMLASDLLQMLPKAIRQLKQV